MTRVMTAKLRKWSPATALGALGQLLCVAAVLTFVAWSAGGGQQRAAAATKGSPIGLSVTGPQSVKSGDPLALTLTVTNQSGAQCSLSPMPEGTVGLVVSRNGVRQYPSMGGVYYEQPLSLRIAKTARVVPPGGHLTVGLASVKLHDGTQVLGSVSLAKQYTVGAQWSLSTPGRYAIGVSYSMPGGKGACTGLSGTATVTVTVTPCTRHSGLALWLPKTLGGLGALATVAALALTVGKRRRGVVRAVATCGVVLLGAGTPGMAQAKIVPAAGDAKLAKAVSACMAIIEKNDPAHIAKVMQGNQAVYNILRADDHEDSARGIGNNGRLDMLIEWNPDETGTFDAEEVPIYNCAELYHEMVHAFDISTLSIDSTPCGGDGDSYADIRATWLENEFRRRVKPNDPGFLRKRYDKKPLPPVPPQDKNEPEAQRYQYHHIWEACGAKGPGRTGAGGKLHSQGDGGPGGSNGDPHMTTFDGARYDFQTVGEFVLAKADGFEVQARQAPLFQARDASVNSALGMRIGSDRLSFSQEDGLRIRVNGADTVFDSPLTKLPGGGSVAVNDDGEYAVTWPDGTQADIVAIGGWGLRIEIYPSRASQGKTRGLLGDDDGNKENDLVTSAGATLPIPPDDARLNGAFADTWRVTDATSLLPYPAGKNSASFTDRTFPDHPLDLSVIPPAQRTQAAEACRSLGIVDPRAAADCTIDMGISGQPSFATAAATTDDEIGPATRPVVPPVVVEPGGTLRDGYVAQGDIGTAGQVDTFHLDVGNAPAVYLVDVDGLKGKSQQPTLTLAVDPHTADAPAFVYTTDYLFPLVQGASYTIKVSRPDVDTGRYSFRLVTAKENRTQLTFDEVTNGNLERPGRADIYRFVAPRTGHLYLEDGIGCDISDGVGDDKPRVRVFTPHSVCWTDQSVAEVESGKSYALALWSFDVKTGPYSFRAVVK